MARIAIVIVTYNSADHIEECLNSLPRSVDYEIAVIDNASADSTCDLVRRREGVTLIANAENRGFAAAVNQGVRATTAPLILLLNPDTRILSGLDHLATEFLDPHTGAAGGMLTNDAGAPQKGFMYRRLPTPLALAFEVLGINALWTRNPVNWYYRCLGDDAMVRSSVEQPAGAFLMSSRHAYQEVGGFNERFHPIWFEDVDYCAKLIAANYSVYYNPAARAVHAGGHSIRTLDVEKRHRYWYGSLLGYAAIHFGSVGYRAVCGAVVTGAMFRGVRGISRDGLKSFAVYGAVCRLALSRLFSSRKEPGSSGVRRSRENS